MAQASILQSDENWIMSASVFLLLNLAVAFYNAGTIWTHEIDIFQTWKLIGRGQFHRVQMAHFHKIPDAGAGIRAEADSRYGGEVD